jgi:hypothetical protein
MKHLIAALVGWLEADAERIREDTRVAEAGVYMRAYMEGRDDVMDTFGLEVTYINGEDEDD